jgi:hypothetical protein
MKQKRINIILLIILAAIVMPACKKSSETIDYNPAIGTANKQVIAERAYSQVFNIFFRVVSDTNLKATGSAGVFGADCSYEQDANGIVYTIDYHSTYTECPDGKLRRGMITAELDKDLSEPAAVATLTFTDYNVDGLGLDGWNTITYKGPDSLQQKVYEHIVGPATLTLFDTVAQITYQWESVKTFTWTEGMDTPSEHGDDVFLLSGTSTGTDPAGIAFSTSIEQSLGDHFSCRWIRTGRTTISMPALELTDGYIDYIGDDTCTNLVIYYFDGNPFYDRFEKH